MYVPFATPLGQRLYPRKGGGGKGSSGKGSTSKSGTSSTKGSTKGSTSKPSSSKKSPLSITGSTGGGKAKKASPFGRGGGKVSTIPSGQPFAGRTQGGGTRDQVFGSRSDFHMST